MFRVTDLKQYAYCARIVYYSYCTPHVRPTTYKMEAGKAAHDKTEELEQRRSLRAYRLTQGRREYDTWLESSTLGLRGKVDEVVRVGEPLLEELPIEYKDTPGRMGRHVELQLTAYALMLEERDGTEIRRGFLYSIPTKRAREVAITPAMKAEVRAIANVMREMVAREQMPVPTEHRERCRACEFRRFCNDVL